jgi:hypothetical protein
MRMMMRRMMNLKISLMTRELKDSERVSTSTYHGD